MDDKSWLKEQFDHINSRFDGIQNQLDDIQADIKLLDASVKNLEKHELPPTLRVFSKKPRRPNGKGGHPSPTHPM